MQARFQVTFETAIIAPAELPTFPYQAIALSYDRVTYVALVSAESSIVAYSIVSALWPASIGSIEQVEGHMISSGNCKTPVLGHLPGLPPPAPRKSVFARIWRYLAGDGPFFKN